MSSPAEMIKDKLVNASVGTLGATTGWGIYIGSEPDDVEQTITIYEYANNPQYAQGDNVEPFDFIDLQIRVKGKAYLSARNKIVEVRDALDRTGYTYTDSSTVLYHDIWTTFGPFFLEQQDDNHFIWLLEVQTVKQKQ